VIASTVCLSLLAGPDTPPSPAPPRFQEDVVVTAERGAEPRAETPAAVSVLTRDDVRLLPAESLAGLLDHMPGFQVLFGSGSGIVPMVSARGFFGGGEAEYVQLLVDGVPVSDVESGLADWRLRSLDVERVEALRGPGAAVYGDTALGGVVQVFRRSAGPESLRDASAAAGSFGSWSADGAYRSGGLGASATASRTAGFRSHAGSREGGASVDLGAGPQKGRFGLTLSGSWRDREDPGSLTRAAAAEDPTASDPLFRLDGEEARRARAALTYRREGARTPLRATVHGAVRRSSQVRTLLLAAGLGDRAHREVSTSSVGARLDAERGFVAGGRDTRVRAGLEASRDHLDTEYAPVGEAGVPGQIVARAEGRRSRLAAFLSGSWRGPGRLRLLAGGRGDVIADDLGPDAGGRRTSGAFSPRMGLLLGLGPRQAPVSAWVQFSRAFKTATLDQLLDPRPFPDLAGGTFRISNPTLVPQRARSWEAGLSQGTSVARWEAVVYRTTVGNEIDFDPATFRYRNIGRSLHQGLEASARAWPGRRVSPHASYAWTRVEALADGRRGFQLKNVPEHLVRAGLRARLPAGVFAEVRTTWSGGRFLDDLASVPADDATLLDVRVEKRFATLRVHLDGENLAGRAWEPVGYLLPDVSGGAVPYVLPGAGRSLRLGLDWSF
jgi:iron complex outermembrane recepter protein